MEIKLQPDLTITVTDRLGNKAYEKKAELKEFRSDDWDKFDYMGKSFEINTFDNGECLIVHLYPYGDTGDTNSMIDSDAIDED